MFLGGGPKGNTLYATFFFWGGGPSTRTTRLLSSRILFAFWEGHLRGKGVNEQFGYFFWPTHLIGREKKGPHPPHPLAPSPWSRDVEVPVAGSAFRGPGPGRGRPLPSAFLGAVASVFCLFVCLGVGGFWGRWVVFLVEGRGEGFPLASVRIQQLQQRAVLNLIWLDPQPYGRGCLAILVLEG